MCHVNLVYCGLSSVSATGLNPVTDSRFFLSHIYDMLTYTNLKDHHLSLFQSFFGKMLAHNQRKIVHLIMQAIQKKILYYVIFIRTKATVCYLGECLH